VYAFSFGLGTENARRERPSKVSCTILKMVSLFKDNNSNFTLFSAKNGSFFVWLENKKQFLTIESITG
jgi:hypothetical protein